MINGTINLPKPDNALLVNFEQGSSEREKLVKAIERLRNDTPRDLPLWIDGSPFGCYFPGMCTSPHDTGRVLAHYAIAPHESIVRLATDRMIMNTKKQWERLPWHLRLHIFRKAAYLLEHKYFYDAVAVTMEDYSKNPYEAMIDVVELIDFWNFNVYFASEIYHEQPDSVASDFNFMDYRPWDGFVAAIPPNNFISIALNLATAPLMMGNVVVCKPAPETIFSFHFMLNILHEAGLPKDVLSVLHGDEEMIGNALLTSEHLSHVHFTGSAETMHKIVETIGANIRNYRGFPEVIGETGGKNFMAVYDDADLMEAAAAITQSAFGYQGRKCSALSRLYLTNGMWEKLRPILVAMMTQIHVGDVADFHNYLGAIISEQEYEKIVGYITRANTDKAMREIYGGTYRQDEKGYWVYPTIIVSCDPYSETMMQEIFGPVLTVYPIGDHGFNLAEVVARLSKNNPYKLTGAIHTTDTYALAQALDDLRLAAGNVYDGRTTGAVVNRQPFGGSGKSGSNSKPGSKLNLYRWVNPRSISLVNSKPQHFAPAYLDRD